MISPSGEPFESPILLSGVENIYFEPFNGPVVPSDMHTFYKRQGPDMRAYRIAVCLAVLGGCGIAAQSPAFSQEYRGTLEQQLACTPDVWRLCGDRIPDVNRIVACLRQNTPQLSGACRAVFESDASVPQPAAPRRRDDLSRPDDDQ